MPMDRQSRYYFWLLIVILAVFGAAVATFGIGVARMVKWLLPGRFAA
jgi:hypothetical protein